MGIDTVSKIKFHKSSEQGYIMAKIYGSRWQIKKDLGEGGQGITYLVKDKNNDEDTNYVLKRLKNNKRIDRFKDEIRAVEKLSHENIVKLVDYNLESDPPYLVTEYCSGGSLPNAKPFWREQPTIALKLFKQICVGVAEAHAKGIIHRDIKPHNIFLETEKGPAVVGDFGICYIEDDGNRFTLTDEAVGARNYIAPELADGRVSKVSKHSDVYSLGKVLYWLISGNIFDREKHREKRWDLRGWNEVARGGFGDWTNVYLEHVNRILDRMIQYDPADRFHLDSILLLVDQAIHLIQREYNPIAKDIWPPCKYCGQGQYELRVKGSDAEKLKPFGIGPIGEADWRILVCNSCGHIQTFRIEQASRREWWD